MYFGSPQGSRGIPSPVPMFGAGARPQSVPMLGIPGGPQLPPAPRRPGGPQRPPRPPQLQRRGRVPGRPVHFAPPRRPVRVPPSNFRPVPVPSVNYTMAPSFMPGGPQLPPPPPAAYGSRPAAEFVDEGTMEPAFIQEERNEQAAQVPYAEDDTMVPESLQGFGAGEMTTGQKVTVGVLLTAFVGAVGFGAWKLLRE
jgi:hypothetical protein